MAVARAAVAALGALGAIAAWRMRRYEIAEESMAPALQSGDYVLAVRRPHRVRPGDVVIFEHPERKGFELVKRVTDASPDRVHTRGDNQAASADVAPVAPDQIEARVVWLYWPPGRIGRVGR